MREEPEDGQRNHRTKPAGSLARPTAPPPTAVNAGISSGSPRVVRWNLGLTLLAVLLLGSSFAFRLRGGAENPSLDAAQALVISSYMLVTPVLCAVTWHAHKHHERSSRANLVLFGIWLLTVIGSVFLHF